MDQGGEVSPQLGLAILSTVRGQPGASIAVRSGPQPGQLRQQAGLAGAVQHWSLTNLRTRLIKIGLCIGMSSVRPAHPKLSVSCARSMLLPSVRLTDVTPHGIQRNQDFARSHPIHSDKLLGMPRTLPGLLPLLILRVALCWSPGSALSAPPLRAARPLESLRGSSTPRAPSWVLPPPWLPCPQTPGRAGRRWLSWPWPLL